ncbi:restriction endonuclease subunit R [Enterococcus mundtii]|uniref:DEAD/DEAH box helicase family protein n=1 Tax=Enterococcus mundtii TaxID=53346 RepID=UPI000C265275|nr:DEAD/DEAH box helicase family protein [Enterococcus mundtii]PJK24548.1 restriction endonuclease subunit R [Enterococcus mundtii]
MSNAEILHKKIETQFASAFTDVPDVPEYITDNLNHQLRPYQMQALRQFIFTQERDISDMSYSHLLFHMATGSGKTVVLAAAILYLFKEKKQQNFIFFVNSDAIIKKTADNLMNERSSKYLFNSDGIVIDGQRIALQLVEVFPSFPDKNTIYLKLTTIQKLHMDLTNPRENNLTFESLEELPLVLLADEAHHINASTKRKKRKLTTEELSEKTWETTISRLLSLQPKNRLLEFTATINLENDELFDKYRDKIVYQYDLKQFMNDGYSKNVTLLQANQEDNDKMLQAVLLSQYRKYVARDNGITLKPVILFKSNKISISQEAHRSLVELLQQLTVQQFSAIIQSGMATFQTLESIWGKMYRYYQNADYSHVIRDIQWDFADQNILDANSKEFLEEKNTLSLNTLEDPNNPFRAIFAVAKLNEGWDVLNLFDIVRISEGNTNTKKTTDSEAQLIGRGARYYPFVYHSEYSFQRRFDTLPSELKALETLHYHTINDSTYIKRLWKSLEESSIQVREDDYVLKQAKVKPEFRKTNLFKNGKIYINQVISTTDEDYQTLKDYNIQTEKELVSDSVVETLYGTSTEIINTIQLQEFRWNVEKSFIQKGIQRNPFFAFSNLKKYVPAVTSMKTFIESPSFLGNTAIHVSIPRGSELTTNQKLSLIDKFLSYVEKNIKNNYMKTKGTPIFEGVALSELINDYYVEISKVNTNVTDMDEFKQPRPMRHFDWYVYDQAIVNSWESSLIDFINEFMGELKTKYEDVYLIRNERKVKIVEINGTRGFMPDFLLYLKDDDVTYQVFIEPKGDHLRLQDQWKEDFLLSLTEREDIDILSENDEVRLIGLKFYSTTTTYKNDFREDFEKKLLN